MPRNRAELEKAAGKLTSAIQKEWHQSLGTTTSSANEEVMHISHSLVKATKNGNIIQALRGGSVTDYLGREWVAHHPDVLPAIDYFEMLLSEIA